MDYQTDALFRQCRLYLFVLDTMLLKALTFLTITFGRISRPEAKITVTILSVNEHKLYIMNVLLKVVATQQVTT